MHQRVNIPKTWATSEPLFWRGVAICARLPALPMNQADLQLRTTPTRLKSRRVYLTKADVCPEHQQILGNALELPLFS